MPAELHVFAVGPHGVGLASGDPATGAWPELLHHWMRNSGFLTGKGAFPSAAGSRRRGLYRGWITLTPTGPGARSGRRLGYITQNAAAAFEIDAAHGPTPGPHRVEVRRVALFTKDDPSLEDVQMIAGPELGGCA